MNGRGIEDVSIDRTRPARRETDERNTHLNLVTVPVAHKYQSSVKLFLCAEGNGVGAGVMVGRG